MRPCDSVTYGSQVVLDTSFCDPEKARTTLFDTVKRKAQMSNCDLSKRVRGLVLCHEVYLRHAKADPQTFKVFALTCKKNDARDAKETRSDTEDSRGRQNLIPKMCEGKPTKP